MNDDVLKLYNSLQKYGYNNLGTSEEFGAKVQDSTSRRKLYDSLTRDGFNNLGTFDEFSGRLVTNQQQAAAAPRKVFGVSLNPAAEQAYKEMMAPKQEERPAAVDAYRQETGKEPERVNLQNTDAETVFGAEEEANPFPYRGGLEQETAEIARLRETVAEDKAFVEEYEKIKNGERKRNQMVSGVNPLAGTDRGADAKWLKDNKDRYKQAKANVEKVESVVSEPENAINKAETDIARRKNREEMASPSEIIATGRTPFGGDNAGRQDSEHQLRKYADELYASADKEYDKSSKYQEGYEGNALEQLWTGIRDFGADALNNIDSGSFTFGLSKGLAGVKAREVGDKYNSIIDGAIKDMGMSEDSVKSILSSIEESVPKLEALEEELTAAGAEIDTMSSTYEDMVRRGDPNAESYGRQLQKKIDAYNKRINDEYKPTWDAYNDNRQAYEDVMAGIDTAIESGLTGGEKALLDALEKFTQAKTLRSDDVSVAGKAGAGAEQSAEFMLDFILTGGISKAGTKVATKIATNRALKKYGADALKEMARVGKTVKPGLGLRLGTDVVTSLARTGVMAPRTIQAYSENLTEYNGKDETGRYEWDRSQANALANSLLTQYIEYWSEGFGEYFGEAERALFRGVTKNAPKTAIGQTLKGYRGSIGQYLDKGKFDGMFNEMLEEVVGSTFNALAGWMSGDRVGDSKAMKDFVSGENLATLALSFLPMSAIGAATNMSAYHKMRKRYDKGAEGLSDYFKTGAVSPEELQQLSKDIPNLSPEEIKDKIVDITDRARKQNGGRLPSDFTQNVLGYLEGEFAMGLRYDEWEDSQEKMSVVNAYTASYTNPDPRAAWDLNDIEQTAKQAAVDAGFTEEELDNDSYMLAQDAFEIRGTQPERSDILMNYASAKAAAEGLRMGYKEQTQQVSEIFDERVRRNVDTNGTVTTATIMLNGKPRTVFITQEDASVDANGNLTTPTGPEGVVRYRLNEMDEEGKTAPASQFSNAKSTDTTQFVDDWQNNFQRGRAAYYEAAQNTVSPTGQARALNERVGQSVIVTDHNGVYQPFKVERLTNGGSSVVLSGDKKALQGVAEAMGIRVPTSGYLEAPVTSLYPLLAKEEDGSLSTGVGETSQQEAATPAQEAAPAAEQAAGLGDLRDQTVPISVNGQVQNAHVIDMSDGSVMYEELDENGDVVRTSRLSETDFARAMQEAANPTPAAEETVAAEEAPAEEPAAPAIPVDEKTGEKIYDAPGVEVADAIADLYATEGLTEADVDQYIAEEAAKAEAARNPERGNMSPQAWGQAKQEAARVADFWAAMQRAAQQRKAQQEEAIEEAVEEATPVETPVAEAPAAEQKQAKPRTAPRLEDLIPEPEDKIVSRLENWSKRTGVKVRIVNSIDEVSDTKAKKALKGGRRLTGWYLPETNEVEVYLPNITNTIEADKTFIHEAVAHKGLLGLLGKKGYDELCDRVWNEMMTPEEQQEFLEYNRHLSGSEEFLRRAAADEYIARLSESLDMPDKRDIFERIIDWIMDKLGWGRDVSGIENAAAKRVAGLETITRSDLYDLLEDSLKRFEKGRKKVSDVLQDENGDVRFSEATYMPFKDEFGNEHEGTRQQLINYMVGQGFPQKQIDDFVQHMDYWYDFTQNIANLVNPDGTFKYQAFHDWSETIPEYKMYEGKIVKAISTLVTNGEYPLNFELSTDCIKREAFTQIINEMLKMDASFWKKLTPANIIEIQNLEKAFGIEVACPLCFVEAKRLNILTWATGVAEKWNTALKAVAPGVKHTPFEFYKDGDMTVDQVERKNGEVIITQRVKQEIDTINSFLGDAKNLRDKDAKRLRDNAKEMEKLLNKWIEEYGAEHDGDITGFTLTKKQEAQLEKVRNRNMKSATGRMMRIIAAHPEVRHTLSPMDLLGSTGLMRIQSMEGEGFAEMLSAIVSANGTGTPKIVQSAVPYDGEIIDVPQARFEKAAGIGGARLFSFSDADLTKIFDIMQIMWDCAARQAKVQSYSKEVPYIVLFGTSGVKINMSMLPEARPGEAIERQYKSATKAGKQRIKHDVEENVGLQLDQDGNIVGLDLSDSHSITDEFARWIFHNPEYNANCGAIMVGIGVNHAIYCMMQPHIRMLIPFHLSGMPLAAREKGDVFWYHDFTNEQNTGVMVNGLRVKLMGKDGSIVPSVKEDFNIYEGEEKEDWDIRDRCRAYIKWCDENGLLPKFPWAVNAEGYANWMREHGYEPRQDFIDAMNAHTTDGVWDEYYKVITDFTAYQPEFDAEGNMIGEKSARHLPVTGRFNTDPKLLQAVFGTNAEGTEVTSEDSMLNNRERSIENANRHAKEIAALAINMLNSGKKASDMVDLSGSQFNNKADSELFLQEQELPHQIENEPGPTEPTDEGGTRFREVTDQAKIDKLEAGDKVTVYRSMQFVPDPKGDVEYDLGDGNGVQKGFLYAPMSAKVDGQWRNPIHLGRWEEAEERPDLANENGEFILDKGDGSGPMPVAYAPYLHTRRSPLNEQFSSAYNRPNLVIVRSEIPAGELTSDYTAEKSKKSTGEHDWPSGKVSNYLAKKGKDTRKVILSRWAKPVEIVPIEQVADEITSLIGDENVAFPYNVVTPGLRAALMKRGVKFDGWQGNKPKNVDELIAGMKEESVESANTKQKQPVREEAEQDVARSEEPATMFRVSNNNRAVIESWLKKRPDISDKERAAVMDYIDGLDNAKLQLAAGRWYANGAIRLPEDMDKVKQAVSVAGKAKVDPLQYPSPMALLDAHADFKPTAERINPDTVSTLHKSAEYPDGVVVYDVDEGEQSRKNMRQIINTHFGEDASPWCLLQGDGKGNLTPDSKKYWNHYNAYPKQVAFKNGKLLAFSANDSGTKVWWDRQDTCHYGIPITKKIEGDELGRSMVHILQDEAVIEKDALERDLAHKYNCPPYRLRELASPEDIEKLDAAQEKVNAHFRAGITLKFVPEGGAHPFKGNRQNGVYEEWTSNGELLIERTSYKDGKEDGLCEAWFPNNGQQQKRAVMKDDHYVEVQYWYDNGNPRVDARFNEKGKRTGKSTLWWKNGNVEREESYTDDGDLIERREYNQDGSFRIAYKIGEHGQLQMQGQTMFREADPAARQEMEEIKKRAQADNTFMKAPNGNPTNLNEEQWLLVRTKNFKNWFGDWENDPANASKVVDGNGEPRVVYHGTKWNPLAEEPGKAVFDVDRVGDNFDFVDIDWNFFFTASEASARGYGNAVPVFLNMRNPEVHTITEETDGIEFDEDTGHDTVINAHDAGSENDEVTRVKNPDGVVYTIRLVHNEESLRRFNEAVKAWETEHKGEIDAEQEAIRKETDETWEQIDEERRRLYEESRLEEFFGASYDEMKSRNEMLLSDVVKSMAAVNPKLDDSKLQELEAKLAELGNRELKIFQRIGIEGRPIYEDFAQFSTEEDYRQTDMFALDNPNQIKSATDNNGEFSLNNPDIRFRERVTPEQDKEYMDAVNAGDMEKAGRMVRDAFKAAFPNTKVVDENGEPKVLYHGTNSEFTEFNPAERGLWFTERIYADNYGKVLMPVFLNAENLGSVGDRNDWKQKGYDGWVDMAGPYKYFTAVVAYPSQVKSADPVTYDDNGNVIPLSERFNPENNDIRFREARPVDARNAQAGYEEEINRKVTNFLLEWQDQDIPVRIAINQVMNEVGMENLPEDCDYLTRHNLVSSRAANGDMHKYKLFYFEPMMKVIGQIEDILVGGKPGFFENLFGSRRQKRLDAYKKIVDYCYAVSALERNEWKRAEAQRLMEKALERLAEKWEQERAAINADSRLNDAEKAESLERAEKRYQKESREIEDKYADRDYSGITALMGHSKEEWQEAEDDARAMIADFQRSVNNNDLINEMWNRIRACTDFNLEHAYKYGLLSRAEYERLHGTESQPRMWEYYIPLRGFAENTTEDLYNYTMFTSDMAGGDVVKKAKGRVTEADDPFATMRHISEQEIVQGLQNWAKQALYNFVLRAGNNSLLTPVEPWYIKDSDSDDWILAEPMSKDNGDKKDETLEEFETRMQEKHEKGEARRGRNGLKLGHIMGNKMHRNQHMIRLKLNGAEKMIWVNGNNVLAQAVNGVPGWNNWYTQNVNKVNRALSQFYTTFSLKFITKNKMRDTQFSQIAALVDESAPYMRQLEKNWWANNGIAFGYPMMKLVSAWESGELEKKENRTEREQMFIDFMYDGGATGYTMINSMDKIKRDLERMVKNAGHGERNIPIIDWYAKGVGALNEASELLTRFTFYQTSRMMGRSRERSAYDAKESSVNFNRRGLRSGKGAAGWTAAAASTLYLFMNPAIQGLDRFVRLHKSHPWRMGLVDATYFMMGFVNSLLNAMIAGASDGDGDDDEKMGPDWYWNIPEWVRRSNMIIGSPFKKLGKWGYLVIALPIEYKGFYAMGELASALVQGKYAAKDAPTIANEVVGVVAELLPVNPVEGYTPGDNAAMSVLRNMAPDIIAPIVDVATNRSFAGIPLWKENIYDEAQPLSQSAFASTPEILNKAVIKLSEVTSDMPWHVDIPSGAVRGLLKGYGGGAYTFVEDMSKLIFADEAHPRRWDNVPFVSGFTGYLEEDRRDSFNSNALQRYKELSDDVVKRVRSAAPGEDLKAADIYNHPESLPQNARVTILLNSDRYILGQMYYNGMLKAGDDVKKLRSNWNKAKKAYLEIADDKNVSDEAKDAAEKEVQRTWLEYTMSEDSLVDRLMEEEYNHARQKIANGIPYEPKETLGEKAYKLTNRK